MPSLESRLEHLGIPVRSMEPPPREEEMSRWLKNIKGRVLGGLDRMNEALHAYTLKEVRIFEQQGPGSGEEFTLLHGTTHDGRDIFALVDWCVDEYCLEETVAGLPPTAWHEAKLLIQ